MTKLVKMVGEDQGKAVSIIKNIRTLKGAAILSERTRQSGSLDFLKYNLIYGFNGSGKSTLSRLFSTLEKGKRHEKLPDDCVFEIEMDDGTIYKCPNQLAGIEARVCVFNQDFVDESLQWAKGHAKPIFYIGREQAALAEQLKKLEDSVAKATSKRDVDAKDSQSKAKTFQAYKRDRARHVAERLRQGNRKYEAPELEKDYQSLPFGNGSIMTAAALDAASEICAQTVAGTPINPINIGNLTLDSVIASARDLSIRTPGSVMIAEIEQHPDMVQWIRQGLDYHTAQQLETCLFCGNKIDEKRRALLAAAFDSKLNDFLNQIHDANISAKKAAETYRAVFDSLPDSSLLSPELRSAFIAERKTLDGCAGYAIAIIDAATQVLTKKQAAPTAVIADELPTPEAVSNCTSELLNSVRAINSIIAKHNELVLEHAKHQETARLGLRMHYLADGESNYLEAKNAAETASAVALASETELTNLLDTAQNLRVQIQNHGPAAGAINRLVSSYLGHNELTISAIADGYELQRHGKLVTGMPSEGEKTAIALCYFLSTLEANGRLPKDLIVVIDDPISSLDTKAMNFACSMILSYLQDAGQLFVLTHNQHCMNEFKKAWRGRARNDDPTKVTARLFFLDVKRPVGATSRTSSITQMSKLLRDHDSEYHFLFQKILQFSKDGLESEYAFMMPNVIRRVLEVFLAFRLPKPGNVRDKLKQLCKDHSSLDIKKLMALERLVQVESHSDSLDDLITHSSMTIEETHDANGALLELMGQSDKQHLDELMRYCRS